MQHVTNVDLMLGQRRRRWANIKAALVQRILLAVRGVEYVLPWTQKYNMFWWMFIKEETDIMNTSYASTLNFQTETTNYFQIEPVSLELTPYTNRQSLLKLGPAL